MSRATPAALKVATNSPLQHLPPDYCPSGSGRWFRLDEGYDAGKTMFFTDHVTGRGTPEATVLMVHGNPECSYTYRHIRDSLMQSNRTMRIVIPDHIGFGISDHADFEMVDMHHAENLLQLVRYLDLQKVILVVHDWGGPIGLGALLQEPERVQGLVVMNTTVFPLPREGLTYRNYPFPWLPWCLTPNLIPDALWGGVAAAVVCHARPQSTREFLALSAHWLRRHARQSIATDTPEYVFSQMLRSKANARSSKRNVRQTPVWGHGYRYRDRRHGLQSNHGFHAEIQSSIRQWGPEGGHIPVCGYFGQWDPCGKESVIAQWHEALPQMRADTHRFAYIGHFIEEYKGPEIADSILQMLSELPRVT
ncbi:MAG: alpha/beta fold hydrolase [Oceanococcaceae bacterium]